MYLFSEIQSRFGTVQRARGCFLYTKKGVRLTDLYREGGRAVLGWGGGSAFTMLKNVLCRGLTGSFFTEYDAQLKRAVEKLLNSSRTVFIYSSYSAALNAALNISPSGTDFYRPWSQFGTDWTASDAVVLAPPLPWTDNLYLVAAVPEAEEAARAAGRQIPDSERIPSPLCAAITRAVHNLIAALQTMCEKDWFIYDKMLSAYWERKGPYLFPKVPQSEYKAFVLHCLDCDIVISPDYNIPSIVPFGADAGVFTKLKNRPFTQS